MTRKKRKRQPNRYRFTKDDCQKGYKAALAKCTEAGWDRLAWFTHRIRGFYRQKAKQ